MAARVLACVADVLGCMAEGQGGLRSGPAANPEWARPFSYLECGDLAGGVKALAQERDKWLSRWVPMMSGPLEKPLVILIGADQREVGPKEVGPQTQAACPQPGAPCRHLSLPSWQASPVSASGSPLRGGRADPDPPGCDVRPALCLHGACGAAGTWAVGGGRVPSSRGFLW